MKLTTRIGEIRDRVLAAESSDVRDELIALCEVVSELAVHLEPSPVLPAGGELPQANNTRVNYLGRNIFSIEGHPGVYMQKKPTPMGPNPDPIVARKCVGKGGASGMFYRVPELEATLREALKEEEAK